MTSSADHFEKRSKLRCLFWMLGDQVVALSKVILQVEELRGFLVWLVAVF